MLKVVVTAVGAALAMIGISRRIKAEQRPRCPSSLIILWWAIVRFEELVTIGVQGIAASSGHRSIRSVRSWFKTASAACQSTVMINEVLWSYHPSKRPSIRDAERLYTKFFGGSGIGPFLD